MENLEDQDAFELVGGKALVVNDRTRVYVGNSLNTSSYTLHLNEKRLVMFAIAQIKKGAVLEANTPWVVKAEEWGALFGMSGKPSRIYQELADATESLVDRLIKIYNSEEDFKTDKSSKSKYIVPYKLRRWLSRGADFDPDNYSVTLYWSEDVLPSISNVGRRYTWYEINAVSSLTSFYAWRLYEALIQWRDMRKKQTSLLELRRLLDVGDGEYLQMNNFKMRVLMPAIKEINEVSDMQIRNPKSTSSKDEFFEQHMTSRSVSGFTFHFSLEHHALSNPLLSKEAKPKLAKSKAKGNTEVSSSYKKNDDSNSDFIGSRKVVIGDLEMLKAGMGKGVYDKILLLNPSVAVDDLLRFARDNDMYFGQALDAILKLEETKAQDGQASLGI